MCSRAGVVLMRSRFGNEMVYESAHFNDSEAKGIPGMFLFVFAINLPSFLHTLNFPFFSLSSLPVEY